MILFTSLIQFAFYRGPEVFNRVDVQRRWWPHYKLSTFEPLRSQKISRIPGSMRWGIIMHIDAFPLEGVGLIFVTV